MWKLQIEFIYTKGSKEAKKYDEGKIRTHDRVPVNGSTNWRCKHLKNQACVWRISINMAEKLPGFNTFLV